MVRFLLAAWILSGWPIFSFCLERKYFFVSMNKNWADAQKYCRQRFTDLATIDGPEDEKEFLNLVSAVGGNSDIWIGLYSKINWTWSNGSSPVYDNWEASDDDPDFISASQFCVCIGDNGKWWDYNCEKEFPFICYTGASVSNPFVVVNEAKNWSSAKAYCKQHFRELANIWGSTENQQVTAKVPTGYWAWTGLFRAENVYWSDESRFQYSNWARVSNPISKREVICGAASQTKSLKWRFLPCEEAHPFVCYGVKGGKKVVRLRLTSSRPLNETDPNVIAQLQRALQSNLTEGASLKFIKQPNGKILQKEKKKTEL